MKVVEALRSPFDFLLLRAQDRPRTNGSVGPGRTGGLNWAGGMEFRFLGCARNDSWAGMAGLE